MENFEKYEIHKFKLKKQTKNLFIVSLAVFLLTGIFAYKTLINIIDFDDFYHDATSQVINFFGGKIAVIIYIFSMILIFLAMLLMCGLSFAMMAKAKNDDFKNISLLMLLMNIGLFIFIISYGIFVAEFIVICLIFMMMCFVTLLLAIPQMWEIFSPLFKLFFVLIPGSIAGVIWFIKLIDMKSTMKNLDFYKYLR